MNHDFKIMLSQCEKQAKKLASTDISDAFFTDLDVFDSYFDQLKQIIQNDNKTPDEKDMVNLQKYIEIFTEKLTKHKEAALQQARNAGKTETIRHYATSSAHEGALKFDKRS